MASAGNPSEPESVSAILPTYNSAPFVLRAIESVLGQETGGVVELIVVDDCSSDGTVDFINERYGSNPRVKLLRMKANAGPGVARNDALAAATGTWIAPIDADDAWTADRLANLPLTDANVDMLFDNLIAYDHAIEAETGPVFSCLPPEMSIEEMAAEKAAGSSFNYGYLKPLIRRSFMQRSGVRYPRMRISEDLLFYLELLAHRPRTRVTPSAGYIYTTPVSATSRQHSVVSASVPDDLLVASALEELIRKYQDRLTSTEVEAISERAERLRQSAPLSRLYDSWTRQKYLAFLRQCLTDRNARRALLRKLGERKPRGSRSPD